MCHVSLFFAHLHHLLFLCGGQPLGLIQVDLGLVEPGADVSQVLVKDFHLVLVALRRNAKQSKGSFVSFRKSKKLITVKGPCVFSPLSGLI